MGGTWDGVSCCGGEVGKGADGPLGPGQSADPAFLLQLLQFDPTKRLSVDKLKSHPFFSTIQWSKLVGDEGRG